MELFTRQILIANRHGTDTEKAVDDLDAYMKWMVEVTGSYSS